MCDYSLHAAKTRHARVGDHLISAAIMMSDGSKSDTRGFTAKGEPGCAVCLKPGTELAFDQNIMVDSWRFGRFFAAVFGRTDHKTARFRKVDEFSIIAHHDALELPNGRIVKLNNLAMGQHATVLQLPAYETVEAQMAKHDVVEPAGLAST